MERTDKQIVQKQRVDKKHARGKRDVFENGGQRILVALEHNASVHGEIKACAYNARTDIG